MARDEDASSAAELRSPAIVRATLIIGGLALLAFLAWELSQVLLLLFGAVVVATILRSLADLIEGYTPLASPWSLALSGLLIAALVAAFFFLLGSQIAAEASSLAQRLPEMISNLGDRLGIHDFYGRVEQRAKNFVDGSGVAGNVASYTTALVGAVADLLLVVAAGIYIAVHPGRYKRGILTLFPQRVRPNISATADNAGRALRLWLLGQLISMTVVGVLITIGLYLVGLPSALALGFIAGLSEFVPIVGPILSAVPAILLAFNEGGNTVLWVIGVFVVVQQVESNLIMPLVQRETVDLPPVLTLFALLSLGVLFGPIGVLLGAPITVVGYVAVKQLYLRDTLEEDVDVPGEPK